MRGRGDQSQRLRFLGRLSTMINTTKYMAVLVTFSTVSVPLCAACDESTGSAPQPRSRVDAIVAASVATASVAPVASATDDEGLRSKVDGVPAKKRRAPLCEGQLEKPASALGAAAAPDRRAAAGEATLAKDPVVRGAKRWTWINFWAAWCVPCREELPLLLRWQGLLKADLNFSFISLDDDERQLSTFLSEQPETGLRQSYWLKEGPTRSAWLDALGLNEEPELPLQLLVDPSGAVRCRVQGAVDAEDLAALRRIVGGP